MLVRTATNGSEHVVTVRLHADDSSCNVDARAVLAVVLTCQTRVEKSFKNIRVFRPGKREKTRATAPVPFVESLRTGNATTHMADNA